MKAKFFQPETAPPNNIFILNTSMKFKEIWIIFFLRENDSTCHLQDFVQFTKLIYKFSKSD